MTEEEWLAATDPKPMLEFLKSKATDRRFRLFACACCRVRWLDMERRSQIAVEVAEAFADNAATDAERRLATVDAHRAKERSGRYDLAWAAASCSARVAYQGLKRVVLPSGVAFHLQKTLLFDIFGNPFHPITLNPSWLTPTVLTLATGIYNERAFDRMPILADALQDAGCDSEEILNHCRQPGEHVRGCWAVDLLTGRE
jgi:hypothetical protein